MRNRWVLLRVVFVGFLIMISSRLVGPRASAFAKAAPQPCTFQLSSSMGCFASIGGQTGPVVTASDPMCIWAVAGRPSWIINVLPHIPMGSSSVILTASANTSGTARSAILTIAGLPFTIYQPSAATCTLPLPTTSATFPSTGGVGSIPISMVPCAGCSYTATTSDPWITIRVGASGTSSGKVGYQVADSGTVSRTGTILVDGVQTFTITQNGAPPCSYALSPTNQQFPAAGGSGTVNVFAGTFCTWSPSSDSPWLIITSSGPRGGNGPVGYSVQPNTTHAPRSGNITLAGETFTVNQSGVPCSYSIQPSTQDFPAGGGSGSFAIMTTPDCDWSAASNSDWIAVTPPAKGIGNGSIPFQVSPNTGSTARMGSVSAGGLLFTINQAAASDSADLSVTITPSQNPVPAGTRLSYSITVTNDGPRNALGTTVTELLPVGVTFTSLRAPGGVRTPAVGATGTVTWDAGLIPPGSSLSMDLLVNVIAAPGTPLTFTASAFSFVQDPNRGNNTASTTTDVLGGGLVTLTWDQPAPNASDATPAPTNLTITPASSPSSEGGVVSRREGAWPSDAACTLTGYNIYISSTQPVQTIPANLWETLPPTTTTTAPTAPAGSFYVVTSLWDCAGAVIESGLTGGTNTTGIPPGPSLASVKATGKLKVTGSGFTTSVNVFVNGLAFVRPPIIRSGVVVQKGKLANGQRLAELLISGHSLLITIKNSDGGIGSYNLIAK
jgi:uncharacterized repeat protein (TIGR01451 family)